MCLARTDHFIYHERVDAAHLQFDGKFNKTSLTASLRDEKTTSSAQSIDPTGLVTPNNKTYNDIFPKVQISQELDKNNRLTAFYTRDIQRPNYLGSFNPFVGYVDQYYQSTGNPWLKPEYINTYEVSDFIQHKYRISLSMVITDDYYNTIFKQDDATKAYISVKANLGNRYQYILHFAIPVDITKWWSINADLSAYHEKYSYYSDTITNVKTNYLETSLNQNFKITSKIECPVN